ncbi:EF-hand domain-containing protein [Aquirhabdus sp.]|uniref:EF-hand domain-containing protein n=1 Tax=Aquirhabdus sp. TaxID=2824160 RepID=UPI00396C5AE1
MSTFISKQLSKKQLSKQPSFKHSLIAAVVIGCGGLSMASWADDSAASAAVATAPASVAPAAAKPEFTAEQRKAWHEKHKAEREEQRTQRRTELFNLADTNKDGTVSLQEWLAFKPPRSEHRFEGHRGGHGPDQGRPDERPEHAGDQPPPPPEADRGAKHLAEWLQKVDANHDNQISLAEAQSNAPFIAKHFNEIDTDHNGLISQDELKAYHEAQKAKWDAKRIEMRTEAFKKADTNHDGQLTLAEWLAFKPHHHGGFWHHLWGRFFGHEHHHGGDHRGPWRDRGDWFKKIDTNGDGQISLSEAQANAPKIAQHFNEIDTDHNGQISQDELHAFFTNQHAKTSS